MASHHYGDISSKIFTIYTTCHYSSLCYLCDHPSFLQFHAHAVIYHGHWFFICIVSSDLFHVTYNLSWNIIIIASTWNCITVFYCNHIYIGHNSIFYHISGHAWCNQRCSTVFPMSAEVSYHGNQLSMLAAVSWYASLASWFLHSCWWPERN